ncbi:transposase [Streptomyces sp. NPDC002012]|uniref:transposase n=1 Tax=Streptomyces sp. NPDC002012 TaxID=3154532 RepID=UPI00331E0235
MIRRRELSDSERGFVRSLLPGSLPGRKRLNDRNALDGVARKFRTGAPWGDVPAIRPVGHTAHRFHR